MKRKHNLRLRQRVYLIHESQGLPSGIAGSVVGYYARTAERTYCVRFDDGDVRELPRHVLVPDELTTA